MSFFSSPATEALAAIYSSATTTSLYSNPSSASSSPEMSMPRPPSPPDGRSKNARAQARHRAKRKAYVENLEATVHQLRAALSASSGASPDILQQIQFLEQENARLRAESHTLRSQLSISTSPTAPTPGSLPSAGYTPISSSSPSFATSADGGSTGLRLPSVVDAMVHPLLLSRLDPEQGDSSWPSIPQNLRSPASALTAPAASSFGQNYYAEDRGRYYESSADYRRRVSHPYLLSPSRKTSTGSVGYDASKTYDMERDGALPGSGSSSRSSQRSYQQSPISAEPTQATQTYYAAQQGQQSSYSTSDSGSVATETATPAEPASGPKFPPASSTAGAYVFGTQADDIKPLVGRQ